MESAKNALKKTINVEGRNISAKKKIKKDKSVNPGGVNRGGGGVKLRKKKGNGLLREESGLWSGKTKNGGLGVWVGGGVGQRGSIEKKHGEG